MQAGTVLTGGRSAGARGHAGAGTSSDRKGGRAAIPGRSVLAQATAEQLAARPGLRPRYRSQPQCLGRASGRTRSASASARPSRSRRRRNAACRAAGSHRVRPGRQSDQATGAGPGQGYNWPKSEHGVYIDDNDFVWLAGNDKADGQLLKFTMDGKFVMQIGKPIPAPTATRPIGSARPPISRSMSRPKRSTSPTAMPTAASSCSIPRPAPTSVTGAPTATARTTRSTPAYDPAKPPSQQFGNPVHCVRIAKDGLVYVCDRTNDRLQVFRKDGTFVAEHFFEKQTRMNGSVYEIAFSPDPEQKFIYMVDGSNGEIRIVERSTHADASGALAGSGGRPASSPPSTTSRSTGSATSTPRRCRPGSASRSSAASTHRIDARYHRARLGKTRRRTRGLETLHGFDRQVQRPLLEGRDPGSRSAALCRLAARDLRGPAPGAAGDRSLRPGLSRRPAGRRSRSTSSYPNTCGIFAHRAIEPTKRLFAAARRAGIPIFYCTQETRPNNRPTGAVSTKQPAAAAGARCLCDLSRVPARAVRRRDLASSAPASFQGTPLFSHLSILGVQSLIVCGESTSGCVRASVGRRLFERLPCVGRGGMHLRPRRAHPQGQPVRPASQICRRHAPRRGGGPSRWPAAWRGGGVGHDRRPAHGAALRRRCWRRALLLPGAALARAGLVCRQADQDSDRLLADRLRL